MKPDTVTDGVELTSSDGMNETVIFLASRESRAAAAMPQPGIPRLAFPGTMLELGRPVRLVGACPFSRLNPGSFFKLGSRLMLLISDTCCRIVTANKHEKD